MIEAPRLFSFLGGEAFPFSDVSLSRYGRPTSCHGLVGSMMLRFSMLFDVHWCVPRLASTVAMGSYGNQTPGFPRRRAEGILRCYLSYPYRRISHPIDIHDSRRSMGERALFHSSASGRSVIDPDFFVLFPPMLCPACIGFPEEAASATSVKSSSIREPILSNAVLGSATRSS